jgi:hypothetical protein
METNGAPRAQRGSFAPTPSGFRRLTPGLLQADRTAENFAGLPNGVTTPGQLLAAFKAADQGSGTFPDDPRWVFPRHGGQGEGRRAEPRSHAVGNAAGRRAEATFEDRPRGRNAPTANAAMGLTSWSGARDVNRSGPRIRGMTQAPDWRAWPNKARTTYCPPPLCRGRNRHPRGN